MVLQAGLDEVARFVERSDPPGSPGATPARQVLAAIAWHLRVGGAWRALPAGLPPWRTVYGGFRRWIEKGLFETLMRALTRRQRRRCGRRPEPRLAIVDTQSIKCIGVRGPRGYDGAKKLVGRKRVALVDAEGHVLALAVVPANVQDRDTLLGLDDGKETWPSLRLAIFDGAFAAERCQVVPRPWHAPPRRREVAEPEGLRRLGAALGRREDLRLAQPLGRTTPRARRSPRRRLACVASLMAANALNNPA